MMAHLLWGILEIELWHVGIVLLLPLCQCSCTRSLLLGLHMALWIGLILALRCTCFGIVPWRYMHDMDRGWSTWCREREWEALASIACLGLHDIPMMRYIDIAWRCYLDRDEDDDASMASTFESDRVDDVATCPTWKISTYSLYLHTPLCMKVLMYMIVMYTYSYY